MTDPTDNAPPPDTSSETAVRPQEARANPTVRFTPGTTAASALGLMVVGGLAIYGFVVSLAGRTPFGGPIVGA